MSNESLNLVAPPYVENTCLFARGGEVEDRCVCEHAQGRSPRGFCIPALEAIATYFRTRNPYDTNGVAIFAPQYLTEQEVRTRAALIRGNLCASYRHKDQENVPSKDDSANQF